MPTSKFNTVTARNLREIVATMPTISSAASRMKLNRQQLNKYLNGSSRPSLRTMRKIASAFNLPLEALSWPIDDLKRNLGNVNQRLDHSSDLSASDKIYQHAIDSARRLTPYCGHYLRYTPTPLLKSHVMISLFTITQQGGATYAHSAERYSHSGMRSTQKEFYRERHLMTFIQDRLQLASLGDPEKDTTPEFSILYPIYTSGVQYITGIHLGCAGYGTKLIYTTNMVMKRIGAGRVTHQTLRSCGFAHVDSDFVDSEVRFRLCEQGSNVPFTHYME